LIHFYKRFLSTLSGGDTERREEKKRQAAERLF